MKRMDFKDRSICSFAKAYKKIKDQHCFLHLDSIGIFDSSFESCGDINIKSFGRFDKFAISNDRILLLKNVPDSSRPDDESETSVEIYLLTKDGIILAKRSLSSSFGHDVSFFEGRPCVALSRFAESDFIVIHFDHLLKDEKEVHIVNVKEIDSSVVFATFTEKELDLYFMDQVADIHFFSQTDGLRDINTSSEDRLIYAKDFFNLCSFYFSTESKMLNLSFSNGRLLGFKHENQDDDDIELLFDYGTDNSNHFQTYLFDDDDIKSISLGRSNVDIFRRPNALLYILNSEDY